MHLSLFFEQLETPKPGVISEPITALKGQHVPGDGSNLEDVKITDGSAVNSIMKPEQSITVYIHFGPKTYAKIISSFMTVEDLKKELVRAGVVTFSIEVFKLRRFKKGNWSAHTTVQLDNNSLPLHHYGVQNDSNLTVIGPYMKLNIVDTESKKIWRMFSRWSSLQELKKVLASVRHFDFFMFVKYGNGTYQKLDTAHDLVVDQIFTDNDTIYLSKDDFFRSYCRLHFKGFEVGHVGFGGESVLSIKLRTQLLSGVPVRNINIRGPNLYDGSTKLLDNTASPGTLHDVNSSSGVYGNQSISEKQWILLDDTRLKAPKLNVPYYSYQPYPDHQILGDGA